MPIPTRAASKSGSARRLYVRRHGVVTTPAITCSDPNGSPLVGMASRHGFPVGQHPYHRSSTGGRSRRLPASRCDGHGRRTGGGGMRRVEPFRTARFPGGDFSGLRLPGRIFSPMGGAFGLRRKQKVRHGGRYPAPRGELISHKITWSCSMFSSATAPPLPSPLNFHTCSESVKQESKPPARKLPSACLPVSGGSVRQGRPEPPLRRTHAAPHKPTQPSSE